MCYPPSPSPGSSLDFRLRTETEGALVDEDVALRIDSAVEESGDRTDPTANDLPNADQPNNRIEEEPPVAPS